MAFRKRTKRDAIALVTAGIVAYVAVAHLRVFDPLPTGLLLDGPLTPDEILAAVLLIGALSVVYAWRRFSDLSLESARRTDAESRVEFLAFHDPLTGLYNRQFAETDFGPVYRDHGGPTALLSINLRGFKKVNDLLGHQGGDRLLKVVADRLREAFPQAFVMRMGGDEFCICIQAMSAEAAEAIAALAIEIISKPVGMDGHHVGIGASIGIYLDETTTRDLHEAQHRADLAMHAAKKQGWNHARLYFEAMALELAERLRVEQELRQALREKTITPYYQPLIHLADGSVHGFEALARWRDRTGEFVPPSLFIDIAENAGLITELFDQLLRRACLDAVTWPSSMILAFNLSPTQLSDSLLGERIVEILQETGLPPERLEIELTESAVVKEMDCAMRVIGDLRRIGIKIALDDFGTGFSSLSQLANIPFDKIKIDRSFVASFETNAKQMKIVRSIVGLGQGLGAATLAEGIELESQYKGLTLLGCEFGQGYLFAKAMPACEVAAFLAGSRGEGLASEPFKRTA